MNHNFIFINSELQNNTYFFILYPDIESFSQAIDTFNEFSNKSINGIVKSDLLLLTGDRTGRFIEGKIINGIIDKSSFTLSSIDAELNDTLNKLYIQLPEDRINKIYPISYRNQIKNLKLQYLS